jgi:ATP-dependent Clp protease ATP-binding subunit ClpA
MHKQFWVESARRAIPQYRQFEAEARKNGAHFIEAEHMLLALAANADTEAGRALIDAGLDHQRLTSALLDEHRKTLAFAGIQPPAEMPPAMAVDGAITFGTSAKAALRRALHAAHDGRRRRGRFDSVNMLIGILGAELGTVPRALAIAGVDRAALIARAREGAGMTGQPC